MRELESMDPLHSWKSTYNIRLFINLTKKKKSIPKPKNNESVRYLTYGAVPHIIPIIKFYQTNWSLPSILWSSKHSVILLRQVSHEDSEIMDIIHLQLLTCWDSVLLFYIFKIRE